MATYPWFGQHLKRDGLEQGLILPDFPIPDYSQVDYKALASDEDVALPISITKADLIIMTQACDLKNDKVKYVTLCPIYSLNEYLIDNKLSKQESNSLIASLNSNQTINLRMLNRPDINPYGGAFDDHLLVKFDELVVFPVGLVKQALQYQGRMIKLLPPYREALSQAFGIFFMRVGDPQDRERAYPEWYKDFLVPTVSS
jgi:hypothetical protein